MEISYTEGPMNLNWKQIMSTVEGDDRFYMDTEEDEVTPKEAGWEFLRMFGKDDQGSEESEDNDSGYSENSGDEESVSFTTSWVLHASLLFKRSCFCSTHLDRRRKKKRKRRKPSIQMRNQNLTMTPTRILRSKGWTGMRWNERQLQMIDERREMVAMTNQNVPNENNAVVRTNALPSLRLIAVEILLAFPTKQGIKQLHKEKLYTSVRLEQL